MAKKKTTAEKLASTPISEISTWSERKMRDELKKARYAVNRRLSAFSRRGMTSAAAIEYLGTVSSGSKSKTRSERAKDIRAKNVENLTRNQMYLELARIHSFFTAKTSTISGQVEVNREQDISIFGEDIYGNPRYTMTQKERTEYWSLYQEYYNQYTASFSKYGTSETVQKIIGDLVVEGTFNPKDLQASVDAVRSRFQSIERMKQQNNRQKRRNRGNVYSGKRNRKSR